MNNGLIWLFMLVLAFVMGGIPISYLTAVKTFVSLEFATSTTALAGLVLISLVVMYAGSLGACAAVQNSNCGGVKDMKAVAQDAAIAMAIQFGFLMIGLFVPGLKTMISSYMVTTDTLTARAYDLGYWGAWGAVYGIAVGATMAGAC